MTVLDVEEYAMTSGAAKRPMTNPLDAKRPAMPTFSDARLGKLQLSTMGLRAFGGYSETFLESQRKSAELAAAAAPHPAADLPPPPATAPSASRLADGQLVPHPPQSIVPPRGQRSDLVLSIRPWETPGKLAPASARHSDHIDADRLPPPWDIGTRPASPRASAPPSPVSSARRRSRQKPPLGYARPSSRAEVERLGASLRGKLDAISSSGVVGGRHERKEEEWQAAFMELVRQVYVECAERGQLLDSVRIHYETKLKEANIRMADQARDLAVARREAVRSGSTRCLIRGTTRWIRNKVESEREIKSERARDRLTWVRVFVALRRRRRASRGSKPHLAGR